MATIDQQIAQLRTEINDLKSKQTVLKLYLNDVISVSNKDNLFEASSKMIKASNDFDSGGLIIDGVSFDNGGYKTAAKDIENLDIIIKRAIKEIQDELDNYQKEIDSKTSKCNALVIERDRQNNVTISAAPKKKKWGIF